MRIIKIIVGLGNQGKQYEGTRHNAGFMAIDAIATACGIKINQNQFGGLYGITYINNEKIILLKPQKYMNLSGIVIKEFMDYYKIAIDDLLIINDDLDTPIGSLKLKYKGSSGGHNGLKNIEENIGSNNYKRIKIGISSTYDKNYRDYVLGRFSNKEMIELTQIISLFPQIFNDYLTMSFDKLMTKYNTSLLMK